MRYIDAEKLVAGLKHLQEKFEFLTYEAIYHLIDSLQQEPRFPQYNNIVDKVFGAGNLESWEYKDAEMLVALAKEELLNSLLQQEQPEVDLEKYIENEINHYGLSLYEASYGTFSASQIDRIIRNAFELGLNARKEK